MVMKKRAPTIFVFIHALIGFFQAYCCLRIKYRGRKKSIALPESLSKQEAIFVQLMNHFAGSINNDILEK